MSPRNSKKPDAKIDVFVILIMVSTLCLIIGNLALYFVLSNQYGFKMP